VTCPVSRPLALGLALVGGWGALPVSGHPASAGPPTIVGVDIVSPHRIPQTRVRAAIGDLVGRPRRRGVIRDTLERLWALGLFAVVRVEERAEAGGARLIYHLERQPHVAEVELRGRLGLPEVDLVDATALARGERADPDRLERARQALLARYHVHGHFGARVDVESRADPATNGRDLTFVIDAGEPARVGSVEIRADRPAVTARVRAALGQRAGRRWRQDALGDGVQAAEQALRQDGFFDARVTAGPPRWDPRANRVDVTVEVRAGRLVRVEFHGNTTLSDAALRERLTFPHVGVVDEAELRASTRALEGAYREAGHHFATVSGAAREAPDALVVRFDIVEGPLVIVESVTVEGRTTIPAARLLARMETRPPRLLHEGRFRAEVLERDLFGLQAFLQSRGFPDAKVGPPRVSFSEDRTRAHVVVVVDEGPLVRLGTIAVEGARVFGPAELRAALPIGPGQPWSRAAAEDGRRLLERRYAQRGYHAARVEVEATRRDGLADLVYRVDEGPQTRVGRILVRGLSRTREHLVRRELPFAEGDQLNPEDLVRAQRQLAALGIFERVEVEPLRPPPVPYADVQVTVREGRPWRLGVGAGYSTFEGGRGFLEVGHDNLFGTARSVILRLRASERGERTDLTYGEPRVLGSVWRGDAGLFHEHRRELGFQLERTGLGLGARRDLAEWLAGLRVAARYQISEVDRFDVDPTLVAEDVEPGQEVVATLGPELALDRRDHPLDPRRGSFHLLAVQLGGLALGGDSDFLKSRLETHWFFSWLPPTVVVLSARLGAATPLRDTPDLPVEERFFAGGSTTVRGYRELRVGPLDDKGNPVGGNGLAVFNAEWRFPIWRWFGGAVFVDTGTVTESASELAPGELRSGVGAGLTLTTPVGPIRLDAGYPLDRVPHLPEKVRFYVTVGHPF
jgi:outer membrane protein insertion porin family